MALLYLPIKVQLHLGKLTAAINPPTQQRLQPAIVSSFLTAKQGLNINGHNSNFVALAIYDSLEEGGVPLL